MKNRILGIGIQELSELRGYNCVYVDKTEIIRKLITNGKFYFLSRPRRFGKSLLLNTIKEIFKGRKELFEGTRIYDKHNFEETYPIIKISFSSLDYDGLGLESALDNELNNIAEKNGFSLKTKTYPEKFKELIIKLNEKNPAVILIDEYDKPIVDYAEEKNLTTSKKNRDILKKFYSAVKDCDKYIKFLFITGVSKFSQVSFFSELNNLNDITFNENYADLTGYTEEEIIENYSFYLERIEKKFNFSRDRLMGFIKLWYNGYSWDGKNFIYNPFSLLNLFSNNSFSNYWFKSGTPTFLTKMIKNKDIDIDKIESSFLVSENIFDAYEIEDIDVTVLLFQAGYLTVKEKITDFQNMVSSYRLAYPNLEVQSSFRQYLLGAFTGFNKTSFFEITKELKDNLDNNQIEEFIANLKAIYAKIPHTVFIKDRESYYHRIIYLLFTLMKEKYLDVEVLTNKGRIDAVIKTADYICIAEFKMNSAETALKQIKDKKYYESYMNDKREILCLGVAFDKEERNIKNYKLVTLDELLKPEADKNK